MRESIRWASDGSIIVNLTNGYYFVVEADKIMGYTSTGSLCVKVEGKFKIAPELAKLITKYNARSSGSHIDLVNFSLREST